ncbi:MAG TPA: methyltransferase domain-containing protein [Bacteroidia bacterium]|nr:methyltransferase domain-containing protein [Bacteroidia bacterium]
MRSQLLKLLRSTGYSIVNTTPLNDSDIYEKIYDRDSIQNHRFYNIGAGEFCHPNWTCIDRNIKWHELNSEGKGVSVDFNLFSLLPLPFESDLGELVYISHTLGHIDDTAVKHILKESFRILKKGGVIRIVVEDMDLFYRAWRNNDINFFYWREWEQLNKNYKQYSLLKPMREASITQLFLEEFAASASEIADEGGPERISDEKFRQLFDQFTYEEAFDYCAARCPKELQEKYPFRHMNWFNEKKLERMLAEAGFNTIYKSGYLQSNRHVLRNASYFDKTVPQLSLYMEAVK